MTIQNAKVEMPPLAATEACPVCEAARFELYRHVNSKIPEVPAGLDRGLFVEARVERCACCGLFRTIPLSDLRGVAELYADDSVCFEASASKLAFGNVAVSSTDELSLVRVRPPASFLDIGCGGGHLLSRAAALGFKVMGLDLDAKAVASVRDRLGFEAHCGTLESLAAGRKFDVITMMGILEHLESPREILRAAAGRLSDGGEFVIGVPNVRSLNRWLARLSRHDWDMFLEPGHLYHYDVATLDRLARSAGLRLRRWKTSTMTIRGKLPLMPTRNAKIEKRIRQAIASSALLHKVYVAALKGLDVARVGDMLFASFERIV